MKAYQLVAVLSAFAVSSTSHASPVDTTQVFAFNQFYFSGVQDGLTGTVIIDTTTGLVTGENFNVGVDTFTGLVNVPVTNNPVYTSALFQTPNATLDLLLPVPTLIGYTGSFTCVEGYRANCVPAGQVNSNGSFFIDGSAFDYAISGMITPVQGTTATPEPASLALLATGVLSVTGMFCRRLLS